MLNDLIAATHTVVTTKPDGILGTSFTIGNVFQASSTFLLGGGLVAILTNQRKAKKDRADAALAFRQVESAEDTSLRADLMVMLEKRDARIMQLERDAIEERKVCADKMTEMQKRHDEAVAGLYGEIKGLRDNMIQQAKSGDVMRIAANAPSSIKRFGETE